MIVTPAKLPKPSKIAHAAISVCTELNITEFCTDDTEVIMAIYDRYITLYPNSLVAMESRRNAAVAASVGQSPYFRREQERRPGGTGRQYYRSRYHLSANGVADQGKWTAISHRPDYIDRCVEIYRLSFNLEAIHVYNPDHMLGVWQLVNNIYEPSQVGLTHRQARAEIADHLRHKDRG